MDDQTIRHGLPLLRTAQAQKELTHNAALIALDTLAHLALRTSAAAPPADPVAGSTYLVPAGAGGAWEQHSGQIASWSGVGWTFLAPVEGCWAWDRDRGVPIVFHGGAWRVDGLPVASLQIGGKTVVRARQPAISAPVGGTAPDPQAREAIVAILSALRAHGLIETA